MTQQPTSETEIFQAAVNLPADQRDQFLDQACGDNQPLRSEIESLLRAHDADGSFLQAPALAATLEQPRVTQTIDEQLGSMIGPYKIREKIGEGGFGVVYVAEQEQPVRRKVALKVIKPGMDSREIVARFEAERQALALMDHPHIAKILDASTTAAGRPYFVMELVRGVPITDYCNAHKLPTKQRLELFIQVCQAVQHAHQKGVVHRDLKPSNVLVAPHDGVPVVKVIDFGVAKALGQQLTDKSIYTRFASMIGTPLYMSPEQAEINALDVDTRSDVYSLGVLLYELLTGTTPFDRKKLESAAFDEMRRIIREETPESPSARVTTMASANKAIAATHGVEAGNLAKIIRGDLDVIVMKALEKERGRRYDTASAFAEDIGRFLNQEAILAKPASTAYRFKKFAQRNRGAMLTGSLIAASLLLATIASTWSAITASRSRNEALASRNEALASAAEAIRARRQAEESAHAARAAQQAESLRAEEARRSKLEAEARQAEATATLNFLTNKLLANSAPDINFLDIQTLTPSSNNAARTESDFYVSGTTADTQFDLRNPTVLELLDRAALQLSEDRIESSFPKQPHIQFTVLHTVAQCYRRLNEFGKALPYAERAAKLAEELYGQHHERAIHAQLVLSRTYKGLQQRELAQTIAQQALQRSRSHFGPSHPVTWMCLATVAHSMYLTDGIYKDQGFIAVHDELFTQLADADTSKLPSHSIVTDFYPEGWPEFQAQILTVASKIRAFGRYFDKANELAERAYATIKESGDSTTPASLKVQANLGYIKYLTGDIVGASQIQKATLASLVKIYGENHPVVSVYHYRLSQSLVALNDFQGAVPLLEKEIVIRTESLQRGKKNVPPTLLTGVEKRHFDRIREQLLTGYLATQRLSDAAAKLSSWLGSEPIADVPLLQTALRVVNELTKANQTDDATRLLVGIEQSVRKGISTERLPPAQQFFFRDDVVQLGIYGEIAMRHLELADWANAERLARECMAQYTRLEESGRFLLPTQTKQSKYCLGRVLLEQGKFDEAEPVLLESLLTEQELSDYADKDTTAHQAATIALEKLYTATDRPELAKQWREKH